MNTWTCEQTEARLTDYLDGVLDTTEVSAFDAHVPSCPRCAPLLAGVSDLLTNLHSMEEVEPPPRLVYNILDKTLGPRENLTGWRAVLGWARGMATARFAYGALSFAATFLVLAMASGFSLRKPKLAALYPANVYRHADSQAHVVYARSIKFISDLRVVYEIQARWRDDSQLPTTNEETLPQSAPAKQPGRTDRTAPSTPRQQNRANEVARRDELLADALPIGSCLPFLRGVQ